MFNSQRNYSSDFNNATSSNFRRCGKLRRANSFFVKLIPSYNR